MTDNDKNGEHQKQGDAPDDATKTILRPATKARPSVSPSPAAGGGRDVSSTVFAETTSDDAHGNATGEQDSDDNPLIGGIIENKFKVLREIGIGGMGVVFEAEHLHLNKRFAIKSIRSKYTTDPNFLERFNQEAKTQALLQHPNIIQVTDFISEGGHFYLVMEYVEGKGLNELISEGGRDEEVLFAIAKDVLKSLGHAHGKGVIHRDIKPSNIMIADDHSAKLMDFGIAFLVDDKTQQRGVAGSPAYMSPEQLTDPERMDHRSDIYAMGIVLFEMFTGQKPFGDKLKPGEPLDLHLVQKLMSSAGLAPELTRIVHKCLQWRPEERFKDCQEIIEQIENYERQTHLECHKCKTINRVQNKYQLKGEKCISCGRSLSLRSRFTKIWAATSIAAGSLILAYLFMPWPGSLVVLTKPENAQIVIDGEHRGISPLEISLSPGEYEVVIKKEGFEDFKRTITVQKHKTTDLNIDLPKLDKLPWIAYNAIKKAYQTAAYICRDLNELSTSEANLEIAKSLGDSALTTAYQKQMAEQNQNIDEGLAKYVEAFKELETIRTDIRDAAYQRYVQALREKKGNVANLAIVWQHFNDYSNQAVSMKAWKAAIGEFY